MEDNINLFKNTSQVIEKILALNLEEHELLALAKEHPEYVWRVLIMDDFSSLVLSTLVNLGKLRNHNVTMHLDLHKDREPLPAVTAIYLIQPLQHNIERVALDCRNGLYSNIHLNFLSPLDDYTFGIAREVLADCAGRIQKVYQQYLSYIFLESTLFSLNGPSFEDLEKPGHSDLEIENMTQWIAQSLFCMLQTCGQHPIIKSSRGFSELVGTKLSEYLEETHVEQFSRPLLLIIDRRFDITAGLHHPWTYQGLIYDVLPSSLNKVVIPGESETIEELNPLTDSFWEKYSRHSFNEVLQSIDPEFNKWMKQYDSMGENISSAFDKVSEMKQKKSQLNLHMDISSHLVSQAKARNLDQFNQIEEDLIAGQKTDLLDIMNSSPESDLFLEDHEIDKLRTQVIAFMNRKLSTLQNSNLQKYLESIRGEETHSSAFNYLSGVAGKFKDRLIGQSLKLPVTRLLHSVLRGKDQSLITYETNSTREFSNVIVFVVGGGAYTEYHNLIAYAEQHQINLVYGATSMISPKEFMNQLDRLSKF